MANFTPGPWSQRHSYNVVKDNRGIANCGGYTSNAKDWEQVNAENEANAQLIAAAPELLEACEKALDWINDFGMHSPTRFGGEAELAIQLQKAISKALGEAE